MSREATAYDPQHPTGALICVGCKTAAAVMVGTYDETNGTTARHNWCETCALNVTPVLVHAGYPVTLLPITPTSVGACAWPHCPRLTRRRHRYCIDHLVELEDTFRVGDQLAPASLADVPWCILCRHRHAGDCTDAYGTPPLVAVEIPTARSAGGYDR